jgi:hypothetical protein
MRLAAISGVNGVYTDEDIRKVVKLALEAREKAEKEKLKALKRKAARMDIGAAKKPAPKAKASNKAARAKAGAPGRRSKPFKRPEVSAEFP